MKESVTYQAILEEGEVRAYHRLIPRVARTKFDAPNERIEMAIQLITDLDRLGRMWEGLFDVDSWQELLAVE